jgi:hypothetical protein
MAVGRLELVEEPPLAAPTPEAQAQTNATVQMLRIALSALSKRSLVAVASLVDFTLITSAFALWWSIIEGPSVLQMETASIYSLFILCIIWLRKRTG